MPFWQGIIGVALIAAVVFALTGVAPFWAGGPTWMLVAFYLLRLRRHRARGDRQPHPRGGRAAGSSAS